jgi:16S rRNA (uracil1498-N3)-methyltransferase
MPATPAYPPKSAPRLFIDAELSEGQSLEISGPSAHYLLGVMRLKVGALLTLFDDRTGEYAATITDVRKRDLTLSIERKLRPRENGPDLWLCQALIKKDRLDWIVEKSCELGISRFVPVLTARCVVDKLKEDRMRAHVIEAAEQCERNALPMIAPLEKLEQLLKGWPQNRTLFFCDERGGAPFGSALEESSGPAAILIGPEGGFTSQENAAIRACPQSVAVSLGPRILRTDTAAVAAISAWMAAKGDWNR